LSKGKKTTSIFAQDQPGKIFARATEVPAILAVDCHVWLRKEKRSRSWQYKPEKTPRQHQARLEPVHHYVELPSRTITSHRRDERTALQPGLWSRRQNLYKICDSVSL